MKTYNIMLSKVFPATHSRKGEPTYFSQKVQAGQHPTAFPNEVPKLHTIRENYNLWRDRIAQVQAGEAEICLRQWTGDNLREVIEFTGLHPKFNDWFKSWEEYEEYVRTHDNIFKLFMQDGKSHYLIEPGCYIEHDDEKVTNRCYPITEGKFKIHKIISLV